MGYGESPVSALDQFLTQFKQTADVIIDSWFVCDNERNIVDFNRAFYSMLPRNVARGLKGKKCYEVLSLNICKDRCIAQQCWQDKKQLRLDEIIGHPAGSEKKQRFILSAMPILDDAGKPVGAIEIQRDVTDEAEVQVKYQDMLDNEAREREKLITQVRTRTKDLLEANQALLRAQRELRAIKKGIAF